MLRENVPSIEATSPTRGGPGPFKSLRALGAVIFLLNKVLQRQGVGI